MNLYDAFVYSYLMHCNYIGQSIYKTNLSKLKASQNKAVWIVTSSSRRSNIENWYKCSGIMKFDYINPYLVGNPFTKYIIRLYCNFDDFFTYGYRIHDHNTRAVSHFLVLSTDTNVSKIGISYQGVWNKIVCANINPDGSEQSLKVMLKNASLSNLKWIKFILNLIDILLIWLCFHTPVQLCTVHML